MADRKKRGGFTFALINGTFPQYYEILGVPRTATRRDVTQAYRPLALSEHPDKNGSMPAANERFANINQARDVLTDPDMRWDYDKQLYETEQAVERARKRAEADQRRGMAAQARYHGQGVAGTAPPPSPGPSPATGGAEGAFDHSFTRGGPGVFRPSQFTAWMNDQRFPFGKYGTPEVPTGDGAWSAKGQGDLVWAQAAETWSACSALCTLAARVYNLIIELESVARAAVRKDTFTRFVEILPDDHAQKFHCGIDILWEILHFSGSGYVDVRRSVEAIKAKFPADAVKEMNRLMGQLDKVHKQMLSTERAVTSIGTQIVGRTAHATTLWRSMEQLCREWDHLIKLPGVIQMRMEEIFRDGTYDPNWQPLGEFYPIEGWKQSRKGKFNDKKRAGRKGSKGSKGSQSGSDEIS